MKAVNMSSFSDSFLSTFSIWLQWLAVVGMFLGLVCAAAIIPVRREMSARQAKQLTEAHSKIGALQPKPFKVRLVAFLDSLDKRIMPALAAGQTKFSGEFSPAQFADLQRMAAEDGAQQFVLFHPGAYQFIGVGGPKFPAEFEIKPELLKP
jgi:hypothetical protein